MLNDPEDWWHTICDNSQINCYEQCLYGASPFLTTHAFLQQHVFTNTIFTTYPFTQAKFYNETLINLVIVEFWVLYKRHNPQFSHWKTANGLYYTMDCHPVDVCTGKVARARYKAYKTQIQGL